MCCDNFVQKMQKGANAFPPKQVVNPADESSEDDSSEEEVETVYSQFQTIFSDCFLQSYVKLGNSSDVSK